MSLYAAWVSAPGGPPMEAERVELLTRARRVYEGLLEVCEAATESLDLRFYRIHADSAGARLAQCLYEAVRRGVRVRVMVDSYGNVGFESLCEEMRRHGVHVEEFNPMSGLGERDLNVRDHAKLAIADARIAWLASANVGDEYLGWHDLGLILEGPIVAGLVEEVHLVFDGMAAGVVPDEDHDAPPWSGHDPFHRLPAKVVANGYGGFAVRGHVRAMLEAATHRVDVHHCYLTEDWVVDLLARRARDGIEVQLIAPRQSDVPAVDAAMAADLPRLLKSGVIVRHFRGPSHRKFLCVDGAWTLFGSANLDARSLADNLEVNLALFAPTMALEVRRRIIEADRLRAPRVRNLEVPWWREPVVALFDVLRPWL